MFDVAVVTNEGERSLKINIQIDRLVVDGMDLPHSQRPLMQQAFESELARLLAGDGLNSELARDVALPSVQAPAIQIGNKNNADAFGQQIAQAVYRGIGQ